MELGSFIQQARKTKGWTQAYAAREINIQQSYLSKIENNQFLPSEEVIQKIASAYELPQDSFAPFLPNADKGLSIRKRYLATTFIGLLCFISGTYALIFQQTFYTYKAEALTGTDTPSVSFLVTDQYAGESYQGRFAQKEYLYTLIGERNIPRKENNWLKASGSLLIIVSIGMGFMQSRKQSGTKKYIGRP